MSFTRLLNFLLSFLNLKLIGAKANKTFLFNVFKSNYKRKVLISYITSPFNEENKFTHTNYLECKTAAEIFDNLGYQVDVCNWNYNGDISYHEYQIIYGQGVPLENAFYAKNSEKIKKIFYSTGCSLFYAYEKSALSVWRFYKKTDILAPSSSRILNYFFPLQTMLSDLIIALGNDYVKNTYLKLNPQLQCKSLSAFYFDVYDIDIEKKDFENARKNFLWFGSSGLLHKGLDIVLNVFLERSDINLHICGASNNEENVMNYYSPLIKNTQNIFNHGFVEIKSQQFKDIMYDCAFVIFPSASEGGSPGLLNVLANGALIPIYSKASSIDTNEIGITLNDLEETEIVNAIESFKKMSLSQLKNDSHAIKQFIRENNSFSIYKENLQSILKEYINA